MRPLKDLQEERSSLHEQTEAVLSGANEADRGLNDEEKKKLGSLRSAVEAINKEIAEIEELRKWQGYAAQQAKKIKDDGERMAGESAATPGLPIGSSDVDRNGERNAERAFPPLRGGKLVAFKGVDAEQRAYAAGAWFMGTVLGNKACQRWLQRYGAENRALAEGVAESGGVFVPDVLAQAIIDLREQYGVFRRLARPRTMTSDSLTIPRRAGGVTAYFTDEGEEITASDPTWNQVKLTARTLSALTRMSRELSEDAIIDIGDWVAREFAYAFALKEDQCGFIGDGTSTYGSIVGVNVKIIDGNHAAGAVDAASTIDTFGAITNTDLATLVGALPAYALPTARWICSSVCHATVFQRLAMAAGGNTIMTLAGDFAPSYMGFPIEISQVMPTSTGDLSNAVMFLFGDLGLACSMGDRRGFGVMTLMERYAELNQIGLIGTERFDINVHDLGDGTTAGPVVAMIGE